MKFIAKFWRANPQLKNGGYETTRKIEAETISAAKKLAYEIEKKAAYGSMSLRSIEEAEAPVEATTQEATEEAAPTAKKLYSAMVKDGKRVVIIRNQDYPNKAAFIRDLRANGYRVDPKKVKPSDVFNYICDHTDMNPWDWDLKKVPEEPTAPQEEQVEEAQEAPKAAAEETSGSKLNPMCEKCANYPTDCAGTHEQVWTGCIHCETAHDENRTFSPKKLRTLTDDQLLTAWESTEHLKDPQCPTIRGWLMDEIERRYPVDFNAWLDQDAPEDSQLRHYVMGRGVSKDDVQNHVYKAL
jgi:hypothetical protein